MAHSRSTHLSIYGCNKPVTCSHSSIDLSEDWFSSLDVLLVSMEGQKLDESVLNDTG